MPPRLCIRRPACIIALAGPHNQVLPASYLDLYRMILAIRFQRFRTVEQVVLMTKLIGDVFERLIQIRGLKREKGHAPGLLSEIAHYLVAVSLDMADIRRYRIDHGVGTLCHLECLVTAVTAFVVLAVAQNNHGTPELV